MEDIIFEATSEFLFARPSFIEGVARILDFNGTLNEYNSSETPDEFALSMDWAVVGQYLHNAMTEYGKEKQETARTNK